MTYRTKTYIAGDWDHDIDLISELYKRNNSDRYALHFIDAHDLTQSRDTSLPCSIKRSLGIRMDASKTFVLVVGYHTRTLTKGSCQHCSEYKHNICLNGNSISHTSFIEYECNKALRDGLKIVVLYNGNVILRSCCPESLKQTGIHEPAYNYIGGRGYVLRYNAIKELIC